MFIQHARTLLLLCITALSLLACGGSGSKADAPVGGLTVTPGNGQVTLSWAETPGVEYWVAYAPTANAIDMGNPPPNHLWLTNIHSPYVLTGLTNGTTYSFAMNARVSGGPGGAQTPSQSATPRFAGVGGSWVAGAVLGTPSPVDLNALAYDGTRYLAVGDAGAIFQSTDGASWTAVSNSAVGSNPLNAAAYVNATVGYVLADSSANLYQGSTLAGAALVYTATSVNALATDGTKIVAVGDQGSILLSTNGSTWTAPTTPPSTPGSLRAVAVAGSTWVAVGDAGALWVSVDSGASWTNHSVGSTNLRGVSTYGGSWVAVGDAGTVLHSTDALTWTATSAPVGSATLYAVQGGAGQFVAVGAAGAIYTSPDTLTWTAQTSSITTDLRAVLGSVSGYVAVGAGGTNAVSH